MSGIKIFHEWQHQDPVIDFTGSESLARQEFRDEADINNIIKKYQATGFLIDPSVTSSRQPMFGDYTNAPDFERAQQIVAVAQENFDALPVRLRERFNYDPVELLRFLDNPDNRDEAIKLGIIEPKAIIEKAAEAATPEPPKGSAAVAEG